VSDASPAPPKIDEVNTMEETQTPSSKIGRLNTSVEHSFPSPSLSFDRTFWLKWMGTTVLATLLSAIFYNYNLSDGDNKPLAIGLFIAVTGISSTVQWFLFREKLTWWILENLAAGLFLGLLHVYLYTQAEEWWDLHLYILLALWIVGNFAFGPILMADQQQTLRNLSPILEVGARQNIFILLLSITLVISALSNINIDFALDSSLRPVLTLYGIAAILTGISFFLKKDVPRNFGFIALAVFLLFDGINIERFLYDSNFLRYFFAVNGIIALASGIFFAARRESWKNFGFLMLSGYLISTGAAGVDTYNTQRTLIFLGIATLFAIPAAIFFFLRK
jgi:hypothetical protein